MKLNLLFAFLLVAFVAGAQQNVGYREGQSFPAGE